VRREETRQRLESVHEAWRSHRLREEMKHGAEMYLEEERALSPVFWPSKPAEKRNVSWSLKIMKRKEKIYGCLYYQTCQSPCLKISWRKPASNLINKYYRMTEALCVENHSRLSAKWEADTIHYNLLSWYMPAQAMIEKFMSILHSVHY